MKNWIFALLLVGTMFAAGAGGAADVRESIMEKRYEMVQCRAGFIAAMAGHAEGYGEGAGLAAQAGKVDEEMEKLKGYVESGDVAGFNRQMASMRPAFANAVAGTRTAMHNALESHGEAGPQNQERNRLRMEMNEDYQAEHEEFVECMSNAARQRIRAELQLDKEWAGQGNKTMERLSQRGYDTSGLEEILEEAGANAEELEEAVGSDMDALELEELRKEAWGRQFRLWAQFQKEKFGLFIERIKGTTDEYDAELAEVSALLDEAASLGDGNVYGPNEARESKELVNEAAEKLRNVVGQMQGGNA